jgi:uncharacterized spore protein YtfJ
MKPKLNTFIQETVPNQEQANTLMDMLFRAARPESLYSPPVVQGDYAVIIASEVAGGMGYGFGGGGGIGTPTEGEAAEGGAGGGGGGGGSIMGRPVAAISVGPDGVHVQPIVDVTKIAIAFFTTFATIFLTIGRIKRRAADPA